MLVAVEGVSAAGKSTLIRALENRYHGACYNLAVELEKRKALDRTMRPFIHTVAGTLDSMEELFLFAARLASKARVARQLTSRLVLADRYHISLIVLGQYVRGLPPEVVQAVTAFALQGLWPAGIIALDVSFKAYQERAADVDKMSHVAREGSAFFYRAQQGFRRVLAEEPRPVLWIDTTGRAVADYIDDVCSFLEGLSAK